ncbi:hypothetical protein CHS0354_010683 [Potamilus streckersoni]|uniref:Cadherin domain-containing protein n=1 Tax=Potamilus streckersoni TaxID=2493646 RepID=A0AAE0WA16_9BIVA|nr:hypothetical protein CHS0354_010683 [Potamilus streckersoni]
MGVMNMIVLLCILLVTGVVTQSYSVTFIIKEEMPVGTFVGNVSHSDEFTRDIPANDLNSLHFSFLQKEKISSLVSIEGNTGVIRTMKVLDRDVENTCQAQVQCIINFDVAAQSSKTQSSFFALISVKLQIIDINDNSPEFPSSTVILEVPESPVVGRMFQIESAFDRDVGQNSIQSYEIETNIYFGLNVLKKMDESFTVNLVVKSALDRETKDQYNVTLFAIDGGSLPKTGSVVIRVVVTDVNDNSPVFADDNITVRVKENTTVSTVITKLSAADRDIGENGRISYRIGPNQIDLSGIQNMFGINEQTGELYLKERLMYEDDQAHKLIIEAWDNGIQPHVSQAIITIYIEDVGNHPPVVNINLLSSGNSKIINVSEGASVDTFVAFVNVEDTDTGENGVVSCTVLDPLFSLQSMARKGYKVIIQSRLDRENKEVHTVTVSCHDNGDPSLTSAATFLVRVTDENDNSPLFHPSTYSTSLYEGNKLGDIILQVQAIDPDLAENAEITYYIANNTRNNFSINAINGIVTTNEIFDREKVSFISFYVLAVDHGLIPKTGTALVSVVIHDINDNYPEFKPAHPAFSIMENKDADVFIGKVEAIDADVDNNAFVLYALHSDFIDKVPFTVYRDGVIKTTHKLDRENQSRYDFIIVAFDHGNPALTSSANVIVTVDDENDNSPVFIFPRGSNNTVTINKAIMPGMKITSIQAYDYDEGQNQIKKYHIISGNEQQTFVIDPRNGDIYLNKINFIPQNKTFSLLVSAEDGGAPMLSCEAELKITLHQANFTALSAQVTTGISYNIVIVVVVVTVTFVLALLIVIIICILRHFDQKDNDMDGIEVMSNLPSELTNYFQVKTSTDPGAPIGSSAPTIVKKKEVSFNLDDSLEQPGTEINTSGSANSVFSETDHLQRHHSDHQNGLGDEEKDRLNQFQLLQLQQEMLEFQTNVWLQDQRQQQQNDISEYVPCQHAEDSYSDASGELTGGSDSGKGGSEEECSNSHSRDCPATFSTFRGHLQPNMQPLSARPGLKQYPDHSENSFHPKTTLRHNHVNVSLTFNPSRSFTPNLEGTAIYQNVTGNSFFKTCKPDSLSQKQFCTTLSSNQRPDIADWDPSFV